MEVQARESKLTRNNSSLLRSSPTIRSSIHSLSSVSEIIPDQEVVDLEEQKPHNRIAPPFSPVVRLRSGLTRLVPVVAVLLLTVYTLFVFFNRDDVSSSENFLLVLTFVAVLLFFVSRNKALVHQKFKFYKRLCDDCAKRFGLSCFTSKIQSKPVQWFIGESSMSQTKREKLEKTESRIDKIIREGVEIYSNGDFYEGEFHKGRCNGSGVYNYFVNGRYEGDWIDGKYDGYGIETWARGSRFRGQYRQGLRHGYGVYKFYTGDTYAGEWFNGQSHGVGVQTCADGSCFVGEFKYGVKHGLGCYHFRNGDRYGGEYFGDKVHGFGVYHFANGHCYEGSWHEGRKQGYGIYTFRNGETKSGEWSYGNLSAPLHPLDESLVRAVEVTTSAFLDYVKRTQNRISHLLLCSVAGCKKRARDAVHLVRVDEQVNKVVMAANRAATAARVTAVKAVQNRMDGKFCDTNT